MTSNNTSYLVDRQNRVIMTWRGEPPKEPKEIKRAIDRVRKEGGRIVDSEGRVLKEGGKVVRNV